MPKLTPSGFADQRRIYIAGGRQTQLTAYAREPSPTVRGQDDRDCPKDGAQLSLASSRRQPSISITITQAPMHTLTAAAAMSLVAPIWGARSGCT